MLTDGGGLHARTSEDQRQRQRRQALEQETGRDRELRDPAAAFRRLPRDLPEEQARDGTNRKAPPEQVDGDDAGDRQQRQ
jgi:hypothetical protein